MDLIIKTCANTYHQSLLEKGVDIESMYSKDIRKSADNYDLARLEILIQISWGSNLHEYIPTTHSDILYILDKFVEMFEIKGTNFLGSIMIYNLFEQLLDTYYSDCKKLLNNNNYSFTHLLDRILNIKCDEEWYGVFFKIIDHLPCSYESFQVLKKGSLIPDEYNYIFLDIINRIYIKDLKLVDEDINWLGEE